MLKCVPLFTDTNVPRMTRIQVAGILYSLEEGFAPPYTIGNPLIHVFKLCCQFRHTMKLFYLPVEESVSFSEKKEDLTVQIIHALAQMLRLRKTNLTVHDKRRFLDYYYEINRGGYICAARNEE